MLIQKSTGMIRRILSISFFLFLFLGMSKASNNTKAVMKKQIRLIHSIFSHANSVFAHVGP